MKMKRARFSEEQIIAILKAAEATGNIRSSCAEHNIEERTFYRWRRKYGRMDAYEARKLMDLERENSDLEKMVAGRLFRGPVTARSRRGRVVRVWPQAVSSLQHRRLGALRNDAIAPTCTRGLDSVEADQVGTRRRDEGLGRGYS